VLPPASATRILCGPATCRFRLTLHYQYTPRLNISYQGLVKRRLKTYKNKLKYVPLARCEGEILFVHVLGEQFQIMCNTFEFIIAVRYFQLFE
jgi:hypothetical protein